MSAAAKRGASLAPAAASPGAASDGGANLFWQSIPGRAALVAAFTALAAISQLPAWPAVAAALIVLSLLPSRRRLLLAVATAGVVAFAPPLSLNVLAAIAAERDATAWLAAWPAVVVATVLLGGAYVRAIGAAPKSLPGRYPVLVLVGALTLLFVVAGDAPLRGAVWFAATAFAMTLGSYVWFLAYAAVDARRPGATPPEQQLGYWRPFWGFSNVPVGKGAAYLERLEARDAAQLAATQLSGLRLMAWCTVLTLAMHAFRTALYFPQETLGEVAASLSSWIPAPGLPPIAVLLDAQAEGLPFPIATRWASVLAEFVLSVLHMTTWGNSIVATARMAGYAIAPNTDRPLLSTSVAEFYNRFYFYFKELLATFFFYPAYLRFFRGWPRLRLAFATVAAAGFGNFLFHFYRDSDAIFRLGFLDALYAYHVYGVYALILGVSIAVSQLRLLARGRQQPAGLRRAAAIFVVVVYYCLLGVLDARSPHPIGTYAALYLSLVVP